MWAVGGMGHGGRDLLSCCVLSSTMMRRLYRTVQLLLLSSAANFSFANVPTWRSWRVACFASPSIPPPPPISMPVWSLSSPIQSPTASLTERDTSMNIVTFAIPVSVEPPKLWAVSLYYNTLTRQSMVDSGMGVLQLLTPAQKHLVPILGKRSGYEKGFSKRIECQKLGFEWIKGGRQSNENESLDQQDLFLTHDGR